MTIGVHLNQQKVPFAKFMKSFRGMSAYDDESKIEQSSSFEGIYTNDSSEGEIRLYALETIPKVRTLSQMDQKIQRDDDQPTPCVLTEGKIVEHVSKIQFRLDLRLEKNIYMKIYFVNISICLFSTIRTLRKSPWNNTKLNCYQILN
jgi:hypothetical protein